MAKAQKLGYSYLSGINTNAAANGDPTQLKMALDGIINQLNSVTAGQQSVNTDTGAQTVPAPPPAGDFTVVGQDGNFIIDITNPQDVTPISPNLIAQNAGDDQNQSGQPILYQLRYADDLAMSVNLTTTDPDAALHRVIAGPGLTKYWQMRSTFDGQQFTEYQYFTSAAVCGPVPVAAGLLRSTSAYFNLISNSTNFATVDSIDNGTSATIRVYGAGGVGSSWMGQQGGVTVGPFPSGSLIGAAYSTLYYVLWNTVTLTYVFYTAASFPNTLVDILVFAGKATTVAAGGGGGTGGGGGSSGGTGGRFSAL